MFELQAFISEFRPGLLRMAEYGYRIPHHGSEILDFINEALDQFSLRFHGKKLPLLERKEMAFWYCLYELETLAEIPPLRPLDPYEVQLFQQLADNCELIRCNKELPERFFALRPDGLDAFADEDSIPEPRFPPLHPRPAIH